MKSKITVRLPEDLRSELENMSEAEQRPVSEIVRDSLRRYVAVSQFRRLRGKVLPYAEAQGIRADEDLFLQAVSAGLADSAAGRLIDDEDLYETLDQKM